MSFMRKTQEGLDPTNFPERFDAASALKRFGEVTACEDGIFREDAADNQGITCVIT